LAELADLDAVKAALIEEWDRPFRRPEEPRVGPQLQALQAPLPPRGGLAIGHGRDPESGDLRLEFRVTATSGPDRQRAERLAEKARLEGIPTALLDFLRHPRIGRGAPKGNVAAAKLAGRRVPLHIGASVAHEMGFAGTLGAFVRLADGSRGFISCAHVLAEAPRARIRAGDAVQQPGQPEAIPVANRVGVLSQYFSRFIPARDDNLDAAVATLDDGVQTMGNIVPDLPGVPEAYRNQPLGKPLAREEVEIGAPVLKIGRTSGLTHGIISAADVQNFRPELGGRKKRITFGRVHEVLWPDDGPDFTEAGDSGSLILTEDGLRPVGIHFCAVPFTDGKDRSYMIPWDRVAEEFPLELDGA
jgi:hypothetical protein